LTDPCKATAGLDGTVILYDFQSEYELKVRSYIQVRRGDEDYRGEELEGRRTRGEGKGLACTFILVNDTD
jgi:hypothetical protein